MKLYICGNGLDLHLGLKSDYKEYKRFLLESSDWEDVKSVESLEISKYFGISNIKAPNITWSNLEEALDFDYKSYIDDNIELFNNTRTLGVDIAEERIKEFDQFNISDFLMYFGNFTRTSFYLWLLARVYSDEIIEKIVSNYNGLLINIIDKNSKFLTFNYTTSLEDILGIEKDNILYIHNRFPRSKGEGKVEKIDFFNPENDWKYNDEGYFQFGSIKNKEINIEEYIRTLNIFPQNDEFSLSDLEDKINYFCRMSTKDISANFNTLENYINDNIIDEVIILGHSYMGIDFPYYEKIIVPKLRNIKWTIFCHNQEDIDNALKFKQFFSLDVITSNW